MTTQWTRFPTCTYIIVFASLLNVLQAESWPRDAGCQWLIMSKDYHLQSIIRGYKMGNDEFLPACLMYSIIDKQALCEKHCLKLLMLIR